MVKLIQQTLKMNEKLNVTDIYLVVVEFVNKNLCFLPKKGHRNGCGLGCGVCLKEF